MSLRTGILIAGSLDWRSEPYRVDWRNSRLAQEAGIPVTAPIRYGRRSQSKTFTMVFDPGCPSGRAKVRLCMRPVSSIADLVVEAKALWVAERPANSQPQAGRTHSAEWGCVALLVSPEAANYQDLLDSWAERVALERTADQRPTYDSKSYEVKGKSAVSNRGLLQIPWPTHVDSRSGFTSCDLLLATATQPTPDPKTGSFPTANVIADAWNSARDAEYFHMNRRNGLHTFQDQEIETLLQV